jgi:RimJ/RimL family protein N-acetyltransferase
MKMLTKAPEAFQTDRLHFRRPSPADAQAIFYRYAGDPAVTRYLSWPTHRTVADTYAFVEWSDAEWERSPAGPYLLFTHEDRGKRVLGSTGLLFQNPLVASVGYALAQDAWGMGYASEALQAMVGLARGIGVCQLNAICHAEHQASARVLQKCGFIAEGVAAHPTRFPNLDGAVFASVLNFSMRL